LIKRLIKLETIFSISFQIPFVERSNSKKIFPFFSTVTGAIPDVWALLYFSGIRKTSGTSRSPNFCRYSSGVSARYSSLGAVFLKVTLYVPEMTPEPNGALLVVRTKEP
jgi:hypothetical protein